jgi:hypothetical protein
MWASNSESIHRVLLAGSCAREISENRPIGTSDVDLIVYVHGSCMADGDMQALSALGLSIGVLIHPLVISSEDAEIKANIAEYRRMIEAAVPIYTGDNESAPKDGGILSR